MVPMGERGRSGQFPACLHLGQPAATGRAEQAQGGIVQVGEQRVERQRDVLPLLPEIVGQAFQRARCDDDDWIDCRDRFELMVTVAQRDRIGLRDQPEAARAELSQDDLVGQDAVGVTDKQ